MPQDVFHIDERILLRLSAAKANEAHQRGEKNLLHIISFLYVG
jgi:hypothetical protein